MLWACLHFPDLPLHAVFEENEQSTPCAVIDGPKQRQQICFVNKVAQQKNIRVGQPLAVARAICSTLQTRNRDSATEKRLQHSLAAWAYRFSSQISLSGNDGLLIEIGASLRLFSGWPILERRLRREIAQIGYAPSLAVAPIPSAARALAIQGGDFFTDQPQPMLMALNRIPIVRSGLQEKAALLLHNVGLRTLRDVFCLPRPELARRIGTDALSTLDRMRGIEQEILTLYRPPDRFEHRIELEYHVEAWPPLLFPLRRLCGELSLFLTARDGGVQRCELVLDHEDHPATRVVVELLTPQRDARTLYELIRSRLENATIPKPVCGVALIAKDLPELRPRHKDLFDPQREQGLEWPELAERLRAHLGDESVRGIAVAADHRPELAWRFSTSPVGRGVGVRVRAERKVDKLPVPSSALRAPSPGGRRKINVSRPLWLLSRAIPLRAIEPTVLAGPERIETGWWDGNDTRRDYYVVETRDGQRAWVFREHDAANGGWMLHGWFA
jgi:protein ImuB